MIINVNVKKKSSRVTLMEEEAYLVEERIAVKKEGITVSVKVR